MGWDLSLSTSTYFGVGCYKVFIDKIRRWTSQNSGDHKHECKSILLKVFLVYVYPHVHVRSLRSTLGNSTLTLSQGLSLNLDLAYLARLETFTDSPVSASPVQELQGTPSCPAFTWCRGLKSDPHTCTANPFQTEAAPNPIFVIAKAPTVFKHFKSFLPVFISLIQMCICLPTHISIQSQ